MTQGLQFSLMFSGLDSLPAADSNTKATSSNATDDAAPSGMFQQMLEEQQPSSSRVGQSFAATERAVDKTPAAPAGISAQSKTSAAASDDAVNKQNVDERADTDSEAAGQADIAEQWLGLIRQANDTSQQLQQKMKFATQQVTLVNNGTEQSIGPILDEGELKAVQENNAGDFDTSNTTLTDLPLAVTTTSDRANSTKERSETIDTVNTALSQNIDNTVVAAVSGSDKTEKVPESELPTQSGKAAGINITAINTVVKAGKSEGALSEPSDIAEQAQKSEETQSIAVSTEAELKLAIKDGKDLANANSPSAAAAHTDANDSGATLHEVVKPADLSAALEAQPSTTPERLPGTTPVTPEQSKAAKSEQSITVEPVTGGANLAVDSLAAEKLFVSEQETQLTAAQSPSVIIADDAESNTATPATTKLAEADDSVKITSDELSLKDSNLKSNEPVTITTAQVSNHTSGKNDNAKAASVDSDAKQVAGSITKDSAGKDATASDTDGQQQQQRQEPRNAVIDRLDVSVSSTQSQHRAAGAENTGITFAEAQAQATEQSNRTSPAQATTPSLAAHLKQLNLQQQDAALQLRERVQLMVRQNIQIADIRLDPADLGQMQIRINLQQEQASVQFIVQQQHTRELLEQQMPRLRELLQQQGIQLGEGQVQQQARQDRQSNEQSGQREQQGNNAGQLHDGHEELASSRTVDVKYSERIVDYYA